MNKDLLLINAAAFLRSVSVGLTGVVVGIYLFRNGFSSLEIGLVIGAGLAGSATATLAVSLRADHLGRRHTLLILSLLGSVAGIALACSPIVSPYLFGFHWDAQRLPGKGRRNLLIANIASEAMNNRAPKPANGVPRSASIALMPMQHRTME
jgi:MFS family permease